MTRAHRTYDERATGPVHVDGAVDVTTPVAGFYRHRMGRGTVAVGIELRFGPPLDPITGEELDRSWRWMAFADGEPIPFDRVWPGCAGQPITEAEYHRFIARKAWAREHAPTSAYAETGKRRDPLSSSEPLPF